MKASSDMKEEMQMVVQDAVELLCCAVLYMNMHLSWTACDVRS